MSKKLMYLAAALILVAACSPKPGKMTKVVGQFGEDAPATVQLIIGETVDTTVAVVNGGFKVEVPTTLTEIARLDAGSAPITFIADGTTITIDPEKETAVSSSKKGAQANYAAYEAWMQDFMAEYRTKMAQLGEDDAAAEAYYTEILAKYNDYQKATIKANGDNILGLIALSQLDEDDDAEMIALLDGFSEEMKANPALVQLRAAYETLSKTAEGAPFVDFTVVQDPESPETSTVKLSDYVGNGKYVLVDFWASWCGPCRDEMPNLKNVYETYAGDRFDMVSVAVADELEDTLAAAEELGITWNQIVNAQDIPLNLYGIEAIPHVILFGPDGTILKRNLRGDQIGEAVREALGL